MPHAAQKKLTNSPKAPFRFKRHILAPFAGVIVFVSILGLLNTQWVVAQAQYRFAKPLNSAELSISTTTPVSITVPTLSIPKLRASAPIVFVASTAENDIENGLNKGVVHYGASVAPGVRGNGVIFGHSSGLPWSQGRYKYIFTLLDKLEKNDKIIIDNGGTRYIYAVSGSEVVTPETVSVLQQSSDYILTLITCTPVGTNSKRLVVTAHQISPVPTGPQEMSIPLPPKPVTSVNLPK